MFSDLEEEKELEIDMNMEIDMLNEFHKTKVKKGMTTIAHASNFCLDCSQTYWTLFMAGAKRNNNEIFIQCQV